MASSKIAVVVGGDSELVASRSRTVQVDELLERSDGLRIVALVLVIDPEMIVDLRQILTTQSKDVLEEGYGPIGQLLGVEQEGVTCAFEGVEPPFDPVESREDVVVAGRIVGAFEVPLLREAFSGDLRC